LLADAQDKVRFALHVLLERQPEVEIVGEATHACDLLTRTTETHPDIVLLAWDLPALDGPAAVSRLRACCPGVAVIALSGHPDVRTKALQAGADAFVSKGDPPEQLLAAVAALKRCRGDVASNRVS
jgi:DNA-binding NarL/FixJ family response regulator